MLASSTAQTSSPKTEPHVISTHGSIVQAAYDKYRAYGIKLHMLADQCPDDAQMQDAYDAQQADCVKGQMAILKALGNRKLETLEDAALLMDIWKDEVGLTDNSNALNDADQLVAKIFDFFQAHLKTA